MSRSDRNPPRTPPPRRRRSAPAEIGDVLRGLIKGSPLGQQLEQARIWEEWETLAGSRLAPHGKPVGIRDGVLRIAAKSPVWMHRYAYQKWRIIERINRMANKELISDCFITLDSEEEDEDSGD